MIMKNLAMASMLVLLATLAHAQDSELENFEGSREPAKVKKTQTSGKKKITELPKKKLKTEQESPEATESLLSDESAKPSAANARPQKSGADSQEGWIIKRTKDGIIKIPRKETFKFEGGEISGAAQRPSQTVLGSRPSASRYSLLPERRNYRSDILGSSGAGAVVGTPTSGLK